MKLTVSLRDFLDSFISRGDFKVSIYEKGRLFVVFGSVNEILNVCKSLLSRKIDYVDLDTWDDQSCLMIVLK